MKRAGILATLGLFLTTLIAPMAAIAGSEGRRNTAIVLTAAAVYSLAKGKNTQGLALGAGSYYAWSRYSKSRQAENRRHSYRYSNRRGCDDGRHYTKKYHPSRHARRW